MKNFCEILIYRVFLAFVPSAVCYFFSGFKDAISFFIGVFFFLTLIDCFWKQFILFIYRAELVSEKDAEEIYLLLRPVSIEYEIPCPQIYLLPSACSNAFVLADKSQIKAIVIGQGLLRILQEDEIQAVFAYLLADAKNPKIILRIKLAVMSGSIYGVVRIIFLCLKRIVGFNAPKNRNGFLKITLLLVYLWQTCINKNRLQKDIYETDQISVRVVKNPLILASALSKMDQDLRKFPLHGVNPFTGGLFILNPFVEQKGIQEILWQPSLDYRIRDLEKKARDLGL